MIARRDSSAAASPVKQRPSSASSSTASSSTARLAKRVPAPELGRRAGAATPSITGVSELGGRPQSAPAGRAQKPPIARPHFQASVRLVQPTPQPRRIRKSDTWDDLEGMKVRAAAVLDRYEYLVGSQARIHDSMASKAAEMKGLRRRPPSPANSAQMRQTLATSMPNVLRALDEQRESMQASGTLFQRVAKLGRRVIQDEERRGKDEGAVAAQVCDEKAGQRRAAVEVAERGNRDLHRRLQSASTSPERPRAASRPHSAASQLRSRPDSASSGPAAAPEPPTVGHEQSADALERPAPPLDTSELGSGDDDFEESPAADAADKVTFASTDEVIPLVDEQSSADLNE